MFIKKSFLYILILVFLYSCEDNRKESQANTAYVDTFSVMKQYDQAKIIEEKYDALLKKGNLNPTSVVNKSNQNYYKELQNRKKAALDSLNRDVNKIIYEYAHNNGYDNVYGSSQDSAVYKGKKNDITQEIIILLNSQIATTDSGSDTTTDTKKGSSLTVSDKNRTQQENEALNIAAVNEAKKANVLKRNAYLKRLEKKKQDALLVVNTLEDESKRKENDLIETKSRLQEAKDKLQNLAISDSEDLDNISINADSITNTVIKNPLIDSLAIHPVVDYSDVNVNKNNIDISTVADSLSIKNAALNSDAITSSGLEGNATVSDTKVKTDNLVNVAADSISLGNKNISITSPVKPIITDENEFPVTEVKDEKEVSLIPKENEAPLENVVIKSTASISSLLEILNEFTANQNFLLKSLDSISSVFEKDNANKLLIIESGSKENKFFDTVTKQINQKNVSQNALLNKFEFMYDEILKQESTQSANNLYMNTLNKLNSDQKNIEDLYVNLFDKVNLYKTEALLANKLRIENAKIVSKEEQIAADKEKLEYLKKTTITTNSSAISEKFDFGYQLMNLQVIKNIENVESGYYLVLAVHNSSTKADAFISKVLTTGQKNIKFFYNTNLDSYFIYTDKFDTSSKGLTALENKSNAPYNAQMVLVKIEK